MARRKTATLDGAREAGVGARSSKRKSAAEKGSTAARPVPPAASPAAETGRQVDQRHVQAQALVEAAHREAERAMAAALEAMGQQHERTRSAVDAAHRRAHEALAAAVRGAARQPSGE